jgi:hypothetical protein
MRAEDVDALRDDWAAAAVILDPVLVEPPDDAADRPADEAADDVAEGAAR